MRHHHSPGIRGQLMWFLCCICLFLLALVWFLSTQLLEPLYTKHIEKQLTTQAESITAELDKAIANGEALSAWSFGHLTVNTAFFDRLATQLYASGSLNSFCVDISDTTMRTIYKIENQSYCNLHETLLSDSANNDMIVSTAVAMRKKCRTTGGFVQTLNPPRLSGSAQLLVGRNTSGGEYTVLVTTSLVHVAEAGRVLSTVLPMAAALIFAFAMTAAWLFSEWFTKPLRQQLRRPCGLGAERRAGRPCTGLQPYGRGGAAGGPDAAGPAGQRLPRPAHPADPYQGLCRDGARHYRRRQGPPR